MCVKRFYMIWCDEKLRMRETKHDPKQGPEAGATAHNSSLADDDWQTLPPSAWPRGDSRGRPGSIEILRLQNIIFSSVSYVSTNVIYL